MDGRIGTAASRRAFQAMGATGRPITWRMTPTAEPQKIFWFRVPAPCHRRTRSPATASNHPKRARAPRHRHSNQIRAAPTRAGSDRHQSPHRTAWSAYWGSSPPRACHGYKTFARPPRAAAAEGLLREPRNRPAKRHWNKNGFDQRVGHKRCPASRYCPSQSDQ